MSALLGNISGFLPQEIGRQQNQQQIEELLANLNPSQSLQGLESGFNTNVGLGQQLIGGR